MKRIEEKSSETKTEKKKVKKSYLKLCNHFFYFKDQENIYNVDQFREESLVVEFFVFGVVGACLILKIKVKTMVTTIGKRRKKYLKIKQIKNLKIVLQFSSPSRQFVSTVWGLWINVLEVINPNGTIFHVTNKVHCQIHVIGKYTTS